MEVYDPSGAAGAPGPPLEGPRRDHMTGVAAGGYFYALAGREGPRNYTVAERYDPSAGAGSGCPRCAARAAASPRRRSAAAA